MSESIRIYLDEDVNVLVGEMLRARGRDVLTTRDAANLGIDDEAQLSYAAATNRVFITHNRVDFERLAVRFFERALTGESVGGSHSGIVIAYRRPSRELTLKILQTLKGLNAADMSNQLRYI